MVNYYIKTNRSFTVLRKFGWIFTMLVALGGLWEPKLGLAVIFIMAGLTLTAFFNGRFWCGNICPHGSLFDTLIHPISRNAKIPGFLKSKAMVIGFFLFFMYNFTNRIFAAAQAWGTASFPDRLGMVFARTYLMVLIAGGLLALLTNARTWCQFCPMGTLEKISYKAGKMFKANNETDHRLTIEAKEKCHQCGKCARVCPFQLEPYTNFSDSNQFDDINCIRCGTCVENCPAGILCFQNERNALETQRSTDLEGYRDRQKITARIEEVNELQKDIKEFIFSFISPKILPYKSGQFVLLKLKNPEDTFRAYSIASYDHSGKSMRVIVKKVDKGFGTEQIFNDYKAGQEVELEGPMGDELVLKNHSKHLFIGNGIGMTPFIGLSEEVLAIGSGIDDVKFVHGQRTEEDFLYHEFFKEKERMDERFHYLPVASRPKLTETPKGYVMDRIKEYDLRDYQVYICGSSKMIKDTVALLLEKDVPMSQIFYESEEKIKEIDQIKKEKQSA